MRAHVPTYQLRTPQSVEETLSLLANEPRQWQIFAGGTDLMVLLEAGKLTHQNYLNIWNLDELRGIEVTPELMTLAALTTYTDIQQHDVLRSEFPMLCQAASETGGLAIQNRGTLGGNIVNASPAADSPPALLAYDAEIELICARGSRWIPYSSFHRGYKQMDLETDELLARVRLRRMSGGWQQYYRKVGTRKAQAISKICFAGVARMEGSQIAEIRIALGSVAPIPLRCRRTEAVLSGQSLTKNIIDQAVDELSREIVPIDDIRSTQEYRLQVSLNVLRDFLAKLKHS